MPSPKQHPEVNALWQWLIQKLNDAGEAIEYYCSNETESRYIKLLVTKNIIRISNHKSRHTGKKTHYLNMYEPYVYDKAVALLKRLRYNH